jgi:hypothetical protein
MSKSILVIDTEDFKDIMETLRSNELYTEARILEKHTQDTTELLEALRSLYACADDYYEVYAEHKYNNIYKALGGE